MIMTRREALKLMSASACMAGAYPLSAKTDSRKMTMNLMPGMIGVSGGQREIIDLAHSHGFESVEPQPSYLAKLSDSELSELLDDMKRKNVVFGAAGLPVDFRQDQQRFSEGLKALPSLAQGLGRAGVKRVGTWLSPGSNSLTYLQHFNQLKVRLHEIASVLKDNGLRFGLEYVGTKTLRERYRYQFIHSMAQTKELISEIGTGNVGFVLDSWHWWQAEDTEKDLLSLTNHDVVAVDLNDAPANVPKEKQQDGQRELPMATGVIDVKTFLRALSAISYDGPVRAEPFNKPLNELDNDTACAKTVAALKSAFAVLD